ncbi:hypothetical protein K9L97_04725 [Candidatus Woesearchaeota archaeon]|nr:hypothetical protein [Candidatus Woesearchaeota archaeon]
MKDPFTAGKKIPQMSKIELIAERAEYVKMKVSEKYKNIIHFSSDGPGILYLAEWGNGKEQRILKTDGKSESPRAIRHLERGYNTNNEQKITSLLPDPELNGIIPIIDYYEETEKGPAITVTKFYKHYEKLEDIVQKIKEGTEERISKTEWEDLATQLLQKAKYFKDNGLYHRDINPKNVMVKRTKKHLNGKYRKTLDVLLIDNANGGKIKDLKEKPLPTAGAHHIIDPLSVEKFTGKQTKYNDQTEIYQVATTLDYAMKYKYGWEFDPDNQTGRAIQEKKDEPGIIKKVLDKIRKINLNTNNLLTQEGTLDYKKTENNYRRHRTETPMNMKKYNEWFRKIHTINEEQRFETIDDAIDKFEKIKNKKTIGEWIVKNEKTMPWLLIGSILLAGSIKTTIDHVSEYINNLSKFELVPQVNGKNLEIENNLVTLDIESLYCYKEGWTEKTTLTKDKYIKGYRGRDIDGVAVMRQTPGTKHKYGDVYPTFEGRIYIEGFEGKKIGILTSKFNEAKSSMGSYEGMGYPSGWINFKIPENIPDGTYNLVIEYYSPDANKIPISDGNNKILKEIKLPPKGTIINRERIPLIIGEPDSISVNLDNVYISVWGEANFSRPDNNIEYRSKKINKNIIFHSEYKNGNNVLRETEKIKPDILDHRLDIIKDSLSENSKPVFTAWAMKDNQIINQQIIPLKSKQYYFGPNESTSITQYQIQVYIINT